MRQSYSKNYFEKYATLTLLKILDVQEEDVLQSDRPDLQIKDVWGIEVTQALTTQEAVADVKKPLYTMYNMNPFNHSHDDIQFVFQKIDDAIERKENKSKNYTHYHHNGLYIFTHCINIKKEQLRQYFQQHSFQTSFYQYIFINCVSCVYQYDIQGHKLSCFTYSLKELMDMNKKSLEYEKHCHKVRRPIHVETTDS